MSSVKLLDGGFCSQLSKILGESLDGHPLWATRFIKLNPEACIQAYRDTIKAGADILRTSTYQASVTGFQKYLNLSEEESINLIKLSVDLIRKAISLEQSEGRVEKKFQISGSIGSYGACLHNGSEYRGEYVDTVSTDTMKQWHRPRVQALIEAGVDMISFETIPALAEAELLLDLIKEYPSIKCWVSFSCKDEQHISHGEKFSFAAKRCFELNPDQLLAVGVNCLHPALVVPLLTSARDAAPHVPLICYPNTEEKYDVELKKWFGKEQCQPLVNYLDSYLDLGVKYIGGCCRSDLQDMYEFHQHLEKRKNYKAMFRKNVFIKL